MAVKLEVRDQNDEIEIIEVDEWDPQKFDTEMRDNDSTGVFIGDQYYWKIDVRRVKPLKE